MTSQSLKKLPHAPESSAGLITVLLAGLLVSLAAPIAQAASAGQVTHLSGTLSAKRADGASKLLAVKSDIAEGDTLSTEADTYARIKFNDGGEVVMRPGTQLKIEHYAYNAAKPESDNILMSLFKGGLRAVTGLVGKRNRDKIGFHTETATIGIRGTHFGALLCQNDCGGVSTTSGVPPPNGLHVDVTSGTVFVRNPAGSVEISAGQFGFVPNSNTPPVIVPPAQGVPVTMPSSISKNKSSSGQGIGEDEQTECRL